MTTTAEVVPVVLLDEKQARSLTEKIKVRAAGIEESVERLWELINQAREGKADKALGYKSWTAYVAAEFKDSPLSNLAKDERKELTVSLHANGMSTRAIASVAGVSQSAVMADVKDQAKPEAPVTGVDGKEYPRKDKPAPKKPTTLDLFRKGWRTVRPRVLDLPDRPPKRQIEAWDDRAVVAEEIAATIKKLTKWEEALRA